MSDYLIYKFTSPSGKSYIGQTKNLKRRRKEHKNNKNCGCRLFNSAIKKYGFDAFNEEVLERELTLEDANFLEEFYIREQNTLSPNGYNLKYGGNNHMWNADSIIKMKETMSGEKNHFYGKQHSEETKNKNREAHLGKKSFCFGKFGKEHPSYGVKVSEERKREISKFMTGRYIGENNPMFGRVGELNPMFGICGENSIHAKKYIVIFPDGHEEFVHGLNKFCKEYKLDTSSMIKVAKGKNTTHKGFKCEYVTEI